MIIADGAYNLYSKQLRLGIGNKDGVTIIYHPDSMEPIILKDGQFVTWDINAVTGLGSIVVRAQLIRDERK